MRFLSVLLCFCLLAPVLSADSSSDHPDAHEPETTTAAHAAEPGHHPHESETTDAEAADAQAAPSTLEASGEDTGLTEQELDLALTEAVDGMIPEGFVSSYEDPLLAERERQAWIAARLHDRVEAEHLYTELLRYTLRPKDRVTAFMALAQYYVTEGERVKAIAVYEKFLEAFPESPKLPEVYLRLGVLYRSVEAHQLAVDAFFTVLKVAFVIPPSEIATYRELSQRAKFEIAETYYRIDDLRQAADFFERVARSATTPEVQAEARLKKAYADLRMGNLGSVIKNLADFPNDFTGAEIVPESRLLLARAYARSHDFERAREAVLNIMREDLRPNRDPTWNYWLRTVGNELANHFFAQGDAASAHQIYLALLEMNADPLWRWPIIFQIGLCLEKQDANDQAAALYRKLVDETAALTETEPLPGHERILELRERAVLRLEHLDWQRNFQARLKSLTEPLPGDETAS